MEEAIQLINKFVHRHYGENPEEFNGPVIILGIGIGGQMTCAIPALGFTVKRKNRKMVVCDSMGIDFRALEEEWLSALRANPKTKLFWVVGSKSGGTDETMINFQMGMKTMIRVRARQIFSDTIGNQMAEGLISKLFDGRALSGKKLNDLNLSEKEKNILRVVFSNLVIVSGYNTSVSRLAKLNKEGFPGELYENEEDKVIFIPMLDNLGGRFQGISPNAFVYNALLGLDVQKMLKAAREEALRQRNEINYRTKQVAVDLWERKIQYLLIAMPNDIIFARLSETLGQMVPESTGKGRLRGMPVGIQTYAYDLAVINKAFRDIKPAGKAYLVLDVKGSEPMEMDKDIEEKNMVIRYELEEISEAALAKLIQFLEDVTAKLGMLYTADALIKEKKEKGFKDIVTAAIEAAVNRANELGKS